MPWTKTDYPNSMKNLPKEVRDKAIEIANALLAEKSGMDEGIMIATAISRAKDWAVNRGKTADNPDRSHITDEKKHGKDRYVIPYANTDWAVKEEGETAAEKVFHHKADAIKEASKEAKLAKSGVTVQTRKGKIEKKISYNPHKQK
jgi:uncharacterized protein YdaT